MNGGDKDSFQMICEQKYSDPTLNVAMVHKKQEDADTIAVKQNARGRTTLRNSIACLLRRTVGKSLLKLRLM